MGRTILSFILPSLARSKTKAAVPSGQVIWAIGDIHGRLDLLEVLLRVILSAAEEGGQHSIVMLGDYVDRGPDSRGVLDRLVELKSDARVNTTFLCGNHDDRMLAFLTQADLGPSWCDYGGREALLSYGVVPPSHRSDEAAWSETSRLFREAIPTAHVEFLRGLSMQTVIGDYLFVHAGLRPGVALAKQTDNDRMWIREPFLSDRRAFDHVVVHGHTPGQRVVSDHRRIAVDTGAYATGVLTAVRLEGSERQAFQTKATSEGIRVMSELI